MRMFRLLGMVGVAALLATPAMATTYNAVTDFSASNNPNGVWSYRDGSGSLLTHTGTTGIGTAQWDNGGGYPSGSYVGVNTGSAATSGTVYYAADSVHLDGQGVGAEVRFTSASGGTFGVAGDFSYGDTSMVTHTVSIVDDLGNTLFSYSLHNGDTQNFALDVTLAAGGWLDFISSSDGGSSYAGTNLQAIVGVPEPGTLALLPAGLLGLGFVRRRFAQQDRRSPGLA